MVFIRNLFKKPAVIITVIILIVIIGYFSLRGPKAPVYNSIVATRGDVMQEVSVTGRVKPARSANLAFEKSGRITMIGADVGDSVAAGQTLARTESGDLYAQLLGAEADLKVQIAKLDELKKGTRPEEIDIQKIKVVNAESVLQDAKISLINTLQDAYVKSDDAVRNKVDQFFNNPKTDSPTVNFSISDSQLKYNLETGRSSLEELFVSWYSSLSVLTIDGNLSLYISNTKNYLNQVKFFLDKAALAVNSLTISTNLTQTIIDGWKAAVSTARTNIGTAISNLSVSEEDLNSAQSALVLVKNELVLDEAGTVPEQISAQEASVSKAEADVANYEAQLVKTIIKSPISGIVTKQDAKIGEIVSANTVVVSVVSKTKFEMEANIAEADIAKVKIGDFASVTLDAYGGDVLFDAKVVFIDPAETIVEGVATYKTTLQFLEEDARVKSGMTANIDIKTASSSNVLSVPQRAVISKDGERFLNILVNGAVKEVAVKIGLRGSDGRIEVLEGINDGDVVVIPN